MDIKIETDYSGVMTSVRVESWTASESRGLLAKVLGDFTPKAKAAGSEDAMTLSEAQAFIKKLSRDVNCWGEARVTLENTAKLLELLAEGTQKIQTIKAVRTCAKMGLKEAKEAVETLKAFPPR